LARSSSFERSSTVSLCTPWISFSFFPLFFFPSARLQDQFFFCPFLPPLVFLISSDLSGTGSSKSCQRSLMVVLPVLASPYLQCAPNVFFSSGPPRGTGAPFFFFLYKSNFPVTPVFSYWRLFFCLFHLRPNGRCICGFFGFYFPFFCVLVELLGPTFYLIQWLSCFPRFLSPWAFISPLKMNGPLLTSSHRISD